MLHEIEDFDPSEEAMLQPTNDEMQVAINSYYEGKITAEQLEEKLEAISLHTALMSQFWDILTHTIFGENYETTFVYDKLRTKQLPTQNL